MVTLKNCLNEFYSISEDTIVSVHLNRVQLKKLCKA